MVIVGIVVNSKASDADMPIAVFDETLDNSDSKVNKKDKEILCGYHVRIYGSF